MDTSDFLQADDLYKVIQVAIAVNHRFTSDSDIERFIGLNSAGRQGRYYRLAAEKLGLIYNQDNHSRLTSHGISLVNTPDHQQIQYIANLLPQLPVFGDAINYLNNTPAAQQNLYDWFVSQYPGSDNTAERRFSTFDKYLRVTGYI
jgi:hypothetical protein